MNSAQLLFVSAGGALMLFAGYSVQRQVDAGSDAPPDKPDWTDSIDSVIASARNLMLPTPASEMSPSAQLVDMLKRGEGLSLHAYSLGDGGTTIGYGRYYPAGGTPPPANISIEQAEAWFFEDLDSRGARWVRTYVTVPVTQAQFDALVSMAFNLKPSSFKTIADLVNSGQDPEDAAMRYVRAGTDLEDGLRNRRYRELALYRTGIYA